MVNSDIQGQHVLTLHQVFLHDGSIIGLLVSLLRGKSVSEHDMRLKGDRFWEDPPYYCGALAGE